MRNTVITHIQAIFKTQADLIRSLPPEILKQRLSTPSNTVGSQFWCILGARESYIKAIESGRWTGFSCSVPHEEADNSLLIIAALDKATSEFNTILNDIEWTEAQDNLLLALLEHEAQHQGQLIRYGYGLGFSFPQSWIDRWAL